jgi:4-amino-4-deoxy-L-arabinose transferase-like glycosyltransferase
MISLKRIYLVLEKESNFLFSILFVATLIRVLSVYFYVPLYNQDELTILYDAISVAETGKDRWGSDNLFIFRSLGVVDNRPPFYFWIEIILVKLFNINEYGTRLVATFFGIIGLLFSYKIIKEIANGTLARIYIIVLTFAPIHILFSSIALESNTIGSSILLGSIYFFIKYTKEANLKFLLSSIFLNVLTIYVYQSYKLIAILIIIAYLIYLIYAMRYRHSIYAFLTAGITASSQILVCIYYPDAYLARAAHMVVQKPHVVEFLFGAITNYFKDYFNENWFFNIDNCVHIFNLRFLFVQFPLYLIGFRFLTDSSLFKRKEYKYGLMLLTFVTAVPQLLTNCNMNVFRNNLIIYYIALIVSFGFYYLNSYRRVLYLAIIVNFIVCVYLGYNSESRFCGFQPQLVSFYKKVNNYDDSFSRIVIDKFGNQPYIYLLYYCKMAPEKFQNCVVENKAGFSFDDITRVDKYYYKERDSLKNVRLYKGTNTLIITENKLDIKPFDSFDGRYFYSMK